MAIRLSLPRFGRKPDIGYDARAQHERVEGSRLSTESLALRLQQECAALTLLYRCPAEYGCDPQLGFWLQLSAWPLPAGMNQPVCPLIILVPRDFPVVSPVTFFLPAEVTLLPKMRPDVLLPAGDNVVAPENWQSCAWPSVRWRPGDDLDRILGTLHAALETAGRLALTLPGVEAVLSSQQSTAKDMPDKEVA